MSVSPTIRITADGSWRVTSDGSVRIIGLLVEADIAGVIDIWFPGIVVQKNLTAAVGDWLARYGEVGEADVPTILANANAILAAEVTPSREPVTQDDYPLALPPYPSGLPRFPDSNPSTDGWSIVSADKVVRG